jgi:hypothetical protein
MKFQTLLKRLWACRDAATLEQARPDYAAAYAAAAEKNREHIAMCKAMRHMRNDGQLSGKRETSGKNGEAQ